MTDKITHYPFGAEFIVDGPATREIMSKHTSGGPYRLQGKGEGMVQLVLGFETKDEALDFLTARRAVGWVGSLVDYVTDEQLEEKT